MIRFGASVFAAVTLWCSSTLAENLGNIWLIGDSITAGWPDSGYREPLWRKLIAAGYDFRFVGASTSFATPALLAAGQEHHDGYGSMAILGVQWYHHDWLPYIATPDKALILIGTNDFTIFHDAADQADAINRLDTLLADLRGDVPKIRFYIGSLLPRADPYFEGQIRTLFNPLLPGLTEKYDGVFVDIHSALTLADLADGVHPNAAGYEKLASAWFAALAVPEPSATVLLAAGLAMLCLWHVGFPVFTRRWNRARNSHTDSAKVKRSRRQ